MFTASKCRLILTKSNNTAEIEILETQRNAIDPIFEFPRTTSKHTSSRCSGMLGDFFVIQPCKMLQSKMAFGAKAPIQGSKLANLS